MAEHVKTPRPYNSPLRRQQAAATRQAILEAADRLFAERGYPATTMETIAGAAGVSLKTVYLTFTTKGGLLRALWDLLLKGDQKVAGVAERQWYRDVLAEPDPQRQLRLTARHSRIVKERIGGILKVLRSAAPTDADADALWRLINTDFYHNQRVIVESLGAKQALRPDLDLTRATDLLWTLNHPDLWLLLVDQRGWTPAQWEAWFGDTACWHLLGPADAV
jgi:AcrR family transcriptional regulator